MNILKNKKGIALENAIMFMMVIFALCILIATLTLIGHYQKEIEVVTLNNKLELDQIGESFCEHIANDKKAEDFVFNPSDYGLDSYNKNYDCDPKNNTLTVKAGNTVVLYVAVNEDGIPTVWRYSEP